MHITAVHRRVLVRLCRLCDHGRAQLGLRRGLCVLCKHILDVGDDDVCKVGAFLQQGQALRAVRPQLGAGVCALRLQQQLAVGGGEGRIPKAVLWIVFIFAVVELKLLLRSSSRTGGGTSRG